MGIYSSGPSVVDGQFGKISGLLIQWSRVWILVSGSLHVRFCVRVPVRFAAHTISRTIRIGSYFYWNWTQFNFPKNIIFAYLFREMSVLPSLGSSAPHRIWIRTQNRIVPGNALFSHHTWRIPQLPMKVANASQLTRILRRRWMWVRASLSGFRKCLTILTIWKVVWSAWGKKRGNFRHLTDPQAGHWKRQK
jgi:hypothetical protein